MGRGQQARLRKSSSKRRRREARREFIRTATTVDKHEYDIDSWSQPERSPSRTPGMTDSDRLGSFHRLRRSRTSSRIFTTVRSHYESTRLLTIGYGLHVVPEVIGHIHMGYGLKTSVAISKGTPITQYEGEILSSVRAAAIHEADPSQSSHFATPVKGGPVINGFQRVLPYDSEEPRTSTANDLVIGKCGEPIILPYTSLKGKGGGSFANHQSKTDGDGPNAEFQPNRFTGKHGARDETGLFIIAIRDIRPGEFIHVNYGDKFINSSKSNIR